MMKTNVNGLSKFKRSQRAMEIECQGTDFTPSFKKNVQVIKYCKKMLTITQI
ncbi:hypothetical protein MQX03_12060 [Chryseobacterium aahli]|uniref:hypothetical protein n=1 Tax=Chryseobacterium aahli TaxID=1278643 RepID=UPI001F5FFBD4|nr:hypothetical protein [Chryseobacterium aahli]MCI3937938.1 hypothetical protein [Chryseobacterium aahli]